MTKNDFIHRVIIAQMANPHAWGGDNNIFRMSPSDIIDKAQDMADFVEQEGIPFDALPMNDGYVHTPLGDSRLSVDKEEPEENEEQRLQNLLTKRNLLRERLTKLRDDNHVVYVRDLDIDDRERYSTIFQQFEAVNDAIEEMYAKKRKKNNP